MKLMQCRRCPNKFELSLTPGSINNGLCMTCQSFESWWYNEGSGMKPTRAEEDDLEVFARRITKIAWANGYFKGGGDE